MGYNERLANGTIQDKYAIKTTGVNVDFVEVNHAICSLNIENKHLNANGFVMGGAIFTLADYAFGCAANEDVENCVTLASNISFTRPAKGPKLFAEAKCVKDGRTICFYEVTITDSAGKIVAYAQTSGFRSNK